MNSSPRQTLARIIAKHGRGICDSPKRIEALLRDLSSQHRREINIIVGALDERVAADLIGAGKSVPRDVLLARLSARLRDNLAYTPEAARWGVETWAVALGILSEDEVEERERLEAKTTQRLSPALSEAKPAATKTSQTNPSPITQPSRPTQPQPKRGVTYAPPKQASSKPPAYAPTPNPPPHIASPAPAAPRRTYTPPANANAAAPPLPNSAAPPIVQPPTQAQPQKSRRITLRGCFITVVVLIVLHILAILLVPMVITLLQEEQAQPSINEPRIR